MTTPVRFGILGCARIARKGMIPALQSSSHCRLAAIASRRPRVAAEWAAEFAIPRACDSYESLLDDPQIDAVYIPASGEEHHRLTMLAAAAGKHVLCEKPLATSVAEAEEMVAACRSHGVLVQEAFMWRHHPRTSLTAELIASGQLGTLRQIHVSFSFPLNPQDWRMQPNRGGGAMWDLGCYGVDAARFWSQSEPLDVYARAHFGETGVDLSMQMALRFPGDLLANIDCSFEAPWRCRMELVGSEGRIEWPTAFQDWSPVMHVFRRSDWREQPEVIACEPVSQYEAQAEAFCRSIRAGRLLAPAENGLANMRVLDQALAMARAAQST